MPLNVTQNKPNNLALPSSNVRVSAGFPNYASEIDHGLLSMDDLCVRNPNSSFYVQVEGSSMEDAGILNGDYLCVDRSVSAKDKDIVVAELNGDFTVKQLLMRPVLGLMPHNKAYKFIPITENDELIISGVVVAVVRSMW
ncbi:translesion error-prone DNA polymerase V autoproteolytic subunit [Marinomonas sp. TI.3.20]|uniref:LexA family protein n=1 Tax=Marinomonas sp. TI.3.20 TaxID=3121296 RepID=UPI00311DC0B6